MYIPDPFELLESQIEANIERQEEVGIGNCMSCGKAVDYDLIPVSAHPAAPAVCFECLSPEDQHKYREFEERIAADKKGGTAPHQTTAPCSAPSANADSTSA